MCDLKEKFEAAKELTWDKVSIPQTAPVFTLLNALQDDKISLDFVVAAANLRAFNYRIAMKSRFDIKCKRQKVPKFAVISTLSSFLL